MRLETNKSFLNIQYNTKKAQAKQKKSLFRNRQTKKDREKQNSSKIYFLVDEFEVFCCFSWTETKTAQYLSSRSPFELKDHVFVQITSGYGSICVCMYVCDQNGFFWRVTMVTVRKNDI